MKFLKNFLELFTNNWWLKLIALLLAIIIYHGEKSDRSGNSTHTTHDRSIFQFR